MIRTASKYIVSGAIAVGAGFAYKHTGPVNIAGENIKNLSIDAQYIHNVINKHATTWSISNNNNNHIAIHSNFVSSNDPVEDRHVISTLPNQTTLISVIDGHAGWQCSELLSKSLHNYVARHLLTSSPTTDPCACLSAAYNEYDQDLINLAPTLMNDNMGASVETLQEMLMPAMAGAVLVTGVLDWNNNKLHIAHAGDCRAVIGRRSQRNAKNSVVFDAIPLTLDHDANNKLEVDRVRKEHPGEENHVTAHNRILGGLQPFRSMGDARYKWPVEIQEWVGKIFRTSRYPYKHLPQNFKTPPYVTANPDVTSYTLDNDDAFLVLATDGLWERVTNDQVIDMVGEYVSQVEKGVWVHEDQNCASHVIRNAFGGRDNELVSSLLRIPAPQSRRYRDDITVVVVFLKPNPYHNKGSQNSIQASKVASPVDISASKITPTVLGVELKCPMPVPTPKL